MLKSFWGSSSSENTSSEGGSKDEGGNKEEDGGKRDSGGQGDSEKSNEASSLTYWTKGLGGTSCKTYFCRSG